MIISASRRTDIPSYYGQWLVNALQRGFVFVPNPYNKQRYYKADLRREAVDCMVFWTKNPVPFLAFLPEIDAMGYPYYFQFTLTPYNRSVEKNLPDKIQLVRTFQALSKKLGAHKMIWRYDPIIVDGVFTVEYHQQAFASMAKMLQGYTQKCIISFVDIYKNMQRRLGNTCVYSINADVMDILAQKLSPIAQTYGISLYTCSEERDLSAYGIEKSSCIDKNIIEEILGYPIEIARDKHQRPDCGCMESIEIGTYNCCANGCSYCYALSSEQSNAQNMRLHNPNAPVLLGTLPENAIITHRENHSVIRQQLSLL